MTARLILLLALALPSAALGADDDGDGFHTADTAEPGEPVDCDDTDPLVHPDSDEYWSCGDGIDNDCNGLIDTEEELCRFTPEALGGEEFFVRVTGPISLELDGSASNDRNLDEELIYVWQLIPRPDTPPDEAVLRADGNSVAWLDLSPETEGSWAYDVELTVLDPFGASDATEWEVRFEWDLDPVEGVPECGVGGTPPSWLALGVLAGVMGRRRRGSRKA